MKLDYVDLINALQPFWMLPVFVIIGGKLGPGL